MLKSTYDKLCAESNILSAVDVLGSFNFFTFTVSLDSLTLEDLKVLSDIKNINNNVVNYKLRKVLTLAVHEYTHFIDATSTVWGINHLLMMNYAYLSSDIYTRNEENFYKAKQFYNHISKIKYPNYYNTIGEVVNPTNWLARPTLGMLFDFDGKVSDEGIVFMRFQTVDGKEIARTPISAVSILEASAMANEIITKVELLSKLSKDEYVIANKSLNEEIMSFIYNKELTEYSACVHMLANQQRCSDVLQAFILVSLLTKIVLNCTEDIFEKIIEFDAFKEILHTPKDSEEYTKIKQGLTYRNIGVLFYLLVEGLPANSYQDPKSGQEGVVNALSKLGLDIENIQLSAKEEFNKKYNEISNTKIYSLNKFINAAKENFDIINIQKLSLPFEELHLPKVILNDIDENAKIAEALIFSNSNNDLANLDIEDTYNELSEGKSWVYRFSEGCI